MNDIVTSTCATGLDLSSNRKLQLPERSDPSHLVLLFKGLNFQGEWGFTEIDLEELSPSWNDTVRSAILLRGPWTSWEHHKYSGFPKTLMPGEYPDLSAAGFPLDKLSSLRRA